MGKDFDHLLALEHLLDVAVDGAQVPLLGDEVLAALGADLFGAEQHQGHHADGQDGHGDIQDAHADEHRQDGDDAGHQLGDALADHLAEGIHVVGVHRHDIAVGVGVKVADGQALHVGEQLDADVPHGALGHIDHDAGVAPGGQDAHQIDAADPCQGADQGTEVGVLLLEHGGDVVVDEGLQKQAGLHIGKGAEENADQHHDAVRGVVPQHLTQDPLEQLAGVGHFGPGAHTAAAAGAMDGSHVLFSHQSSPPCLSKSPPPWVWLL